MNSFKFVAFAVVAGFFYLTTAPKVDAQVSVDVGVAPVCPYGYYDVPPYSCAPYGNYGPEWFNGGLLIGAGHWFHGPSDFHGGVDNRFDPHHGYHSPLPQHGDKPFNHFRRNE